jgi:hypothetical protein
MDQGEEQATSHSIGRSVRKSPFATAFDQALDTGDGGLVETAAGVPGELLGGGLSDRVVTTERAPAHRQGAVERIGG